jgi:tetratricopeptide (TPR) repeat protein
MVALTLGLMSKPMLVTFPFVVLLFDVWPLRRIAWPKMLWEKLPLFALSVGSSVVTYLVQRSAGALSETSMATRLETALISYVIYIRQTFWPDRLVVFYTYPASIPVWQAAAALVILLGVSAAVMRVWRTRPYLAVGWLWYLGTLVPVIGLVRAGQQAHADRYTYLPMIGLLIMLAWGAVDLIEKWPRTETLVAGAAAVSCFACLVLALKQTAYWQNSETLYRRAIDASENNWATENNLGVFLSRIPERQGEAVEHFEAALRIKPDYPQAENNLGWCLATAGLYGPAIEHYQQALRLMPDLAEANENMGRALLNCGREVESIPYFGKAVRAKPNDANKHFGLALALSKIPGRVPEAISQYEAILRMSPDDHATHYNLGLLFERLGRLDEAIAQLDASQRIHADADVADALDRVRGEQEKKH